jgi:hypothetical protein
MTAHRVVVLALAALGVLFHQIFPNQFRSSIEELRQHNWEIAWTISGGLTGALTGHLVWVLLDPRRRLSRAGKYLTTANIVVWLSYVIVTPPLGASEFRQIEVERVTPKSGASGLDNIFHWPIVVAGRWHGTYGPMNFADGLLSVFASPAIDYAHLQVVPSRYVGSTPTRGESFVVAAFAFFLSTAFWAAFGDVVSGGIQWIRRRSRKDREAP